MADLEVKLYDETIEQEVFKEILDALTFIEPQYIPGEDFKKLNGDILVETKNKNTEENKKSINRKDYILYLPDNGLKINEVAGIIALINKKTFGENLPKYASAREMQVKIIIAFDKITELLRKDPNDKKIKKALSRFTKTYSDLGFNIQDLNSNEKKAKILEDFDREKRKEYEKNLLKTKIKIGLTKTKDSLNNENIDFDFYLDNQLEQHLEESFFERGVNNLRYGLMIMTQGEQALLTEKKEGEEITIFHSKTGNLEKKEKLLRDKINIDEYKKELEKLRKIGDKNKIIKKELEIINILLFNINKVFPYFLDKNWEGGHPSKIIQNKKMYCLGYAIVGHVFLEELGIKHKGIDMIEHSVLEINIGMKKYIFDAANEKEIFDFKYGNKYYGYYKIKDIGLGKKTYDLIQPGNFKNIILAQIYQHLGNKHLGNIKDFEKALKMYDKSISFNDDMQVSHVNKGYVLYDLERYKEAIKEFDKSIVLLPKSKVYKYIGLSLKKIL